MSTLTPERWQEISPYLDQVLSLPEEERAAWLESLRENKPGVADLLQKLLDSWSPPRMIPIHLSLIPGIWA